MAAGPRTPEPDEDDDMVVLTPFEPDAIDWLDNGSIRFRFDGSTYTLNAPKLGGIVWLMDIVGQFDADSAAIPAGPKRGVQQVALVVKTLRKIFAKFSSEKLPAKDDDLPAVFTNPNLLGQIIAHFRAVPLGSGQ